MKKLIHSLRFKSLFLPSNIFYAPLAGCSDYPFRQMASSYSIGLMFCEMVKMDALIRLEKNTFHLLDYKDDMHPIGAQLCGSQPKLAGATAKIIEDLGFDVVDLNCGCPVDKITKDGSGSGMLKNPHLIGDVIANMVSSVKIPVTVKIRMGWDLNHINAEEITHIAEEAGAVAIAIHGRTRVQKYKGKANWDIIGRCKKVAKSIHVIGNGDLFTPQDALHLIEQSGCDGILISRGTMGQPWIAASIRALDQGKSFPSIDTHFIRSHLLKHGELISLYRVEAKALLDLRRVSCWFLRQIANGKELRGMINRATTVKEALSLIRNYEFPPV